jgi:hypothetical protein
MKGVVGPPIKGEDNVEKGVKLVYRAVHRKAYPSKKKSQLYSCPRHGDACTKDCAYYKDYMKSFNKRKMLKPLITTDKELSAYDSGIEQEEADDRINQYFQKKE